jgi:hypothetical protein
MSEDTHAILFGEDPGACPYCDTAFEFVRPGKSQPNCDCQEPVEWVANWQWRQTGDFIRSLEDERAKLRDERNAAYRALVWAQANHIGWYAVQHIPHTAAFKAARAFIESEKEAKE